LAIAPDIPSFLDLRVDDLARRESACTPAPPTAARAASDAGPPLGPRSPIAHGTDDARPAATAPAPSGTGGPPADFAAALRARWPADWESVWPADTFDGTALRDELIEAWSTPPRTYHGLEHLHECLTRLDAWRDLAEQPGEIAMALWFHDAILDVRRHDNEARSGAWALRVLTRAGVDVDRARRVRDLVVATRHDGRPCDADCRVMLDIDLAILGAEPARYDRYETDVRREYAHVSDFIFRRRRAQLLEDFLVRPRIYRTERAKRELEDRARSNLARALERLGR
jgi:predicted metal-dependent HD superfamily phosphohydrolase